MLDAIIIILASLTALVLGIWGRLGMLLLADRRRVRKEGGR